MLLYKSVNGGDIMEKELITDLSKLLELNKYQELKESIVKYNEVDIAEFLESIDEIEALAIFRLLPKDIAIETFSYLESESQEKLISAMTKAETVELVDHLYIDDMVDLLEEMPTSIVKKIMRNIDHEKRDLINEYLNYPKYSAGSIMTPDIFPIKKENTIQEILNKLRHLDNLNETFYTLYITNEKEELEGFVEIRDILTNAPSTKINEIYNENVIYVDTLTDQEEVAKILEKYQFVAIPVVDQGMKLVGVITFDDAIQVLHEETEEDFSKMAAMSPNEKEYLDTSIFELSKMRFFWLLILMISSTLSQYVINSYGDLLTVFTGLVAFMPMLTDSAGNAGSQASTTIIRGLSIGEIDTSDFLKILFKEFTIALIVGIGLAIVNYIRIMVFRAATPMIALTVSLTLIATIVISKLVGATLPMIATKLKLDPTIMSAPLLTTIVDSVSLVIYFTIAGILL